MLADSALVTSPLRRLSDTACRAHLAGEAVGRIAVTQAALPLIVPVNYVMDEDTIFFRTRHDGAVARACDNAVIAFEIDALAADGTAGWSVNVVGVATLVPEHEVDQAWHDRLRTAAGPERNQFVRMRVGMVTGREIAAL